MKRILLILFLVFFSVFQLEAHVRLNYPKGGELFNPGQTVTIAWEELVMHNTLNWDLYFSADGGISWFIIEEDISVSILSYQWLVPEIQTNQGEIKIVQDNEGLDYESISNNFTISNADVKLIYPHGGELFYPGDTVAVEWQIINSHNTLNWDLFFSSDGGITWDTIMVDIPADSLSYQWIVPSVNTTHAKIQIVMDNEDTDYYDRSKNFTISTDLVELIYPVKGEKFFPYDTVIIHWKILVNRNILNWDLLFSGDGGFSWDTIQVNIPMDSLSYPWVVPETQTSYGQIKIIMHTDGIEYSDRIGNFTITPYLVELIYPLGGELFFSNDTVYIHWESTISNYTRNWDLFFSSDGGSTWETIKEDIPSDSLSYRWIVPETMTSQGQINLVMDNEGPDYEDRSENFTITKTSEIRKQTAANEVHIYPNPMDNYAILELNNTQQENYTLSLFNAQGRLVRKMSNISVERILIQRKNLRSGMYFIQLSNKREIYYTGVLTIK